MPTTAPATNKEDRRGMGLPFMKKSRKTNSSSSISITHSESKAKTKKLSRIRGLLTGESRRERTAKKEADRATAIASGKPAPVVPTIQDEDEQETIYGVDVENHSTVGPTSVPSQLLGQSDDDMDDVEGDEPSFITEDDSVDHPSLQVILLLMDPKTRRFELLQLEFDSNKAVVRDVLAQVPHSVTEEALRHQNYTGVCDRTGQELYFSTRLCDVCGVCDVLIALPSSVDARECARLARPILQDKNVLGMLRASGVDTSSLERREPSMTSPSTKIPPVVSDTPTATPPIAAPPVAAPPVAAPPVVAPPVAAPPLAPPPVAAPPVVAPPVPAKPKPPAEAAPQVPAKPKPRAEAAPPVPPKPKARAEAALPVPAKPKPRSAAASPAPTKTKPRLEAASPAPAKTKLRSEATPSASQRADVEAPPVPAKSLVVSASPPSPVAPAPAAPIAPSVTAAAPPADAVTEIVALPVEEKKGGSKRTLFVVLFAAVAVLIQVVHMSVTAPLSPGHSLSPNAFMSKCGYKALLPSCREASLIMHEDGVLTMYRADGSIQWEILGTTCRSTSNDCKNGLVVNPDGSLVIGGKRMNAAAIYGKPMFSPWPFTVAPNLRLVKGKK